MIDKLKNMFSKNDGNNKKKIENITVFIIIMIVTIVAINYIWNSDKEDEVPKLSEISNEIVQVSNDTENDDIETKLANILSNIEGVGEVRVMLTYSETSTYIPVYNENTKGSNTTETDSTGGSRTISEEDSQKEVVYKEDNDGNKEPVTRYNNKSEN